VIRTAPIGLTLFVAAYQILCTPSVAQVLITQEEARLPTDNTTERSLFPGPKFLLEFRNTSSITRSPFHLKIKFQTRGARVNLDSLYVTYKKLPPVDLTDRLKEFIEPDGIDMQGAEAPVGTHRITIGIKDKDDLESRTEFILTATKQIRPNMKCLFCI
jgi:hypothetical protein